MIKVVQLRINLINLRTQTIDTLALMNNKDVMEILYEFFKVRTIVMDLSKFDQTKPEVIQLKEVIKQLQDELKNNKNRNDIKIKKLEELIKNVFERLNIDNISELTGELKQAVDEAKAINSENERLASVYGGHFSFVKTYSESIVNYDADKSDIEQLLKLTYEDIQNKLKGDAITIQGKNNFVNSIKKDITPTLFSNGLYSKVKDCLTDVLNDLYTNIQLFM